MTTTTTKRRRVNRGVLTSTMVGRVFGVCPRTAAKMMDQPEFPAYRVGISGQDRRVTISMFESYLGTFPKSERDAFLERLEVVIGAFDTTEVA